MLRPFDAARDGSQFGEGAGALVLETDESARARGARVIGEVLGGGYATEGEGLLAIRADGDGPARAMAQALDDARVKPADVGMIVAHANGTRPSDRSEAAAIRRVFGSSMPPVTGFKWAFGHLIAAAGILETVVGLAALRANVVPGIATLQTIDPECEGLPVSAKAQAPRSPIALVALPRLRGHQRRAGGSRDMTAPAQRCGIDTVEIARMERLVRENAGEALWAFFTPQEIADAGDGPGQVASLAARFAAKEACVKLFPREAALAQIEPSDFSVARDNFGAPQVVLGPRAEMLAGRYHLGPIALSMTHDRTSASAVAVAQPARIRVPLAGRLLYHLAPFRRRVILENLRRVFGETLDEDQIVDLAQAHYGHLWRLAGEFFRFRWLTRERKLALVRIENLDAFIQAYQQGKGVLLLTGHFGNWEVATVAGIGSFPQMRGRFHFVRRALKPDWFDRMIVRRFERAGFGVLPKRGSLDAMLSRLANGDAIVFAFDQHAQPPDGIAVDFFGTPAWTFKSLAIIALATGAPVVPATSWREADGRHVLRFETPIPAIEHAKHERGDPTHDERLQRRAREARAAPARAVVLGPSALEAGGAGRTPAQAAARERMSAAAEGQARRACRRAIARTPTRFGASVVRAEGGGA